MSYFKEEWGICAVLLFYICGLTERGEDEEWRSFHWTLTVRQARDVTMKDWDKAWVPGHIGLWGT